MFKIVNEHFWEGKRKWLWEHCLWKAHSWPRQLLQKFSPKNESVDIKILQNLCQGDTNLIVFPQSCYTGSCFRTSTLPFLPAWNPFPLAHCLVSLLLTSTSPSMPTKRPPEVKQNVVSENHLAPHVSLVSWERLSTRMKLSLLNHGLGCSSSAVGDLAVTQVWPSTPGQEVKTLIRSCPGLKSLLPHKSQ